MTVLWKRPVSLEGLNALGQQCLVSHLGIRFTEVGDKYLLAVMPVDERTRQPFGLLHGGASVVLAESMGSLAGWLTCEEGQAVVGIEVSASHHRAVTGGEVTGRCYLLHLGAQLQVWQTEIRNPRGKLCCTARLTLSIQGLPTGHKKTGH